MTDIQVKFGPQPGDTPAPPPGFVLDAASSPASSGPPPPPPGFQVDAPGPDHIDMGGAPAVVRATVGGFGPDKQLEVLRQFYPDAQKYREDNFVFTNPQTGKPTIYNPEGLDWGDAASLGKEAFQAVGSGIGATLGAAGGSVVPGPGTIAGGIAGAGLGQAGGSALYDAVLAAMGIKDPRTLGEKAVDLGTDVVMGSAGQGIGSGIGAAIRGGVRSIARGAGEKAAANMTGTMADYASIGAKPSIGNATSNRSMDAIESFLGRMPGSSGIIAKSAQQTIDAVQSKTEQIAAKLATSSTSEQAGRTIQRGLSGFIDTFKRRASDLYNVVDGKIPPDLMIPVSNTKTMLNELGGKSKFAKIFADAKIKEFGQTLGSDEAMQFGDLKEIRSFIGSKLTNPDLGPDLSRRDLRRFYGAMAKDLEAAASAMGAEKDFAKASKFYEAGMDRIDPFLESIAEKARPEDALKYALQGTEEGATRLRAMMRSLQPGERDIVSANVIRGLGRASAGQQNAEGAKFSVETMLTNWNKLSPEAKDVLFTGQTRRDLDVLARIAGSMRESSRVFKNPSGTAGQLVGQAMMMGAIGAASTGNMTIPLTIATGAVSANGAARLMTYQPFVNWLAKSTTLSPNGLGAHIARLSEIAMNADEENKTAIKDYLGVLSSVNPEK